MDRDKLGLRGQALKRTNGVIVGREKDETEISKEKELPAIYTKDGV